ncbi:glycosyltransferase [Mesobacillus campisalis]|uniref:glycosyltransferase n=1 Tax=Mesobacillus campisalis TaxID=1408103 RepID=UPI0006994D10|nr:glycosyltransferase [Mesobacillus campisalis]
MISIIACTNRKEFVHNIISNFQKQLIQKKELILIVNSSKFDFKDIEYLFGRIDFKYKFLHFPSKVSLGECLNKGVEEASYNYIGKMDDDDLYGPLYLKEGYETICETNADVVGKSSFFIYFNSDQELRLYNPKMENRWILNTGQNVYKSSYFFSGATLIMKKDVFKRVTFPNVSVGEDSEFQRQCFYGGFKMYSLSKDNYVYIRYIQTGHHHSDATENLLKRRSCFSAKIPSIEEYFEKN